MPRPYQTPEERKRMMKQKMASEAPEPMLPAGDSAATEAPAEGASESEMSMADKAAEPTSSFLPKETFGGRTFQPGDTVEFEIVDVDPQTGEVEVKLTESEVGSKEDSTPGYQKRMDEMMPED